MHALIYLSLYCRHHRHCAGCGRPRQEAEPAICRARIEIISIDIRPQSTSTSASCSST